MSLVTQLTDLTTRIATETKSLRTLINGNVANLSALTTTDKTNLVVALNEVAALAIGAGSINDGSISLSTTWSSTKITAETAAAIAALVDASPGTLDTLNELAAALGDDPNFATTLTTSLAGKQPLDGDLTAISGLVSAANTLVYYTGAGAASLANFTAFARTLIDDVDAATMRTTLGLGTAATTATTAYDAAGVAATAQAFAIQRANHTGTQTAATISDFNTAADARVVAGITGKQPLDTDLTAIAALVSAADQAPYATGTGAWALHTLTAFARTLLDDVDAAAMRTTLGLGTAATTATTAYEAAGSVATASTADRARANHTGTQSADTLTDGTTNKAFLATERTKLTGIATAATANSADATLLARANHTGTQLAATISDFNTAADARVVAGITGKQPLDADLTAIAALTSAADQLPYATGAGAWALTTLTTAGRALIDDSNVAAQRTTLDVYSTVDVGSIATDFVAAFNAGLV